VFSTLGRKRRNQRQLSRFARLFRKEQSVVRQLSVCAFVLVAACASAPPAPPPAADPSRIGMQPPPDTCGAARYAHLIGRPMTEAPAAGSMPNYRLAALDDPLTMDYSPQRLNIFYDRATGRIVGIRCF
jgi:hypothetical protein